MAGNAASLSSRPMASLQYKAPKESWRSLLRAFPPTSACIRIHTLFCVPLPFQEISGTRSRNHGFTVVCTDSFVVSSAPLWSRSPEPGERIRDPGNLIYTAYISRGCLQVPALQSPCVKNHSAGNLPKRVCRAGRVDYAMPHTCRSLHPRARKLHKASDIRGTFLW